MPEFKLKRGRKVYHIREFSSILELASRGLIAPDDPIFVPSIERWVYARAIHELAPLLEGMAPRGDDADEAEELPLAFVEPLVEPATGATVEIDLEVGEVGIGATPGGSEGADAWSSGGEGRDAPHGSRGDVWSATHAWDVSEQVDQVTTLPAESGGPWQGEPDDFASVRRARDLSPGGFGREERGPGTGGGGPEPEPETPPGGEGPEQTGKRLEPAGTLREQGVTSAPISFQDWMAQQAREGALNPGADGVLPVLSGVGVEEPREERVDAGVRWARVVVLAGALAGAFGVYYLYVKHIAGLEFEPMETPRVESVSASSQGNEGVGVSPAPAESPFPGMEAMDLRLRRAIPPNVSAFRNFEQAEDRLFGELLNLKIGVADVKLDPVDGDRAGPVRRTETDVMVRVRNGRLPVEEQTGMIGLVIGKYISRDRLRVRDLVLRIERSGQVPVVRIVPGKSAEAYFTGRINLAQYLLAVQAGTVTR